MDAVLKVLMEKKLARYLKPFLVGVKDLQKAVLIPPNINIDIDFMVDVMVVVDKDPIKRLVIDLINSVF